MESLSDLLNKAVSDRDHNGCVQIYHTLFHDKREKFIALLEINFNNDNHVDVDAKTYTTLHAWRDFFPNGNIIGIDKDPCAIFQDERIQTYLCDSCKSDDISSLLKDIDGFKFDIIIDNGCKNDTSQIKSLRNLYQHLNDGGIYIIQNVASKLIECPGLIDCLCNHDPYFFTGLKHHMCVIYKNYIKSKRVLY